MTSVSTQKHDDPGDNFHNIITEFSLGSSLLLLFLKRNSLMSGGRRIIVLIITKIF